MNIIGLFTQAANAAFNLMVREQPRAVAVIKKIKIFMRDHGLAAVLTGAAFAYISHKLLRKLYLWGNRLTPVDVSALTDLREGIRAENFDVVQALNEHLFLGHVKAQIVFMAGQKTAACSNHDAKDRAHFEAYQVLDTVLREVAPILEETKEMVQFCDALSEDDMLLPPMEQLGKIAKYASEQMTYAQYMAIREKYEEPKYESAVCGEFFYDLAVQIEENKEDEDFDLSSIPTEDTEGLAKYIALDWQSVEEMPHFHGVLSDADRKLPPLQQLGKLVEFAKGCMTEDEYKAIRQRYPNPICVGFFRGLAEQIQANKDDATLALAFELSLTGLTIPEDEVEDIRAWFNDPANEDAIAATTEIYLRHRSLRMLPDELIQFTGLRELGLSGKQLEVDVSALTQLSKLYLVGNQLKEVDVSALTELRELDLSR